MMSDQSVEFLRHRKEHASTPNIDWQAKKDRWVRSVQELYGFIEEMLREPIKSKDVTVNRFDMEVTEDYIGCYTIPALALTVGNERVEFRPKGVTVTGSAVAWMFAVTEIRSLCSRIVQSREMCGRLSSSAFPN
jgi:hypothetical protein